MDCRPGCAACCIAPSISSPIPGMPRGKPAAVRCVQLTLEDRCALFDDPRRPAVCASLAPSAAMCGADRLAALAWLGELEDRTRPDAPAQEPPAGSGPHADAPPWARADVRPQ